jgi:hypothetical protein
VSFARQHTSLHSTAASYQVQIFKKKNFKTLAQNFKNTGTNIFCLSQFRCQTAHQFPRDSLLPQDCILPPTF